MRRSVFLVVVLLGLVGVPGVARAQGSGTQEPATPQTGTQEPATPQTGTQDPATQPTQPAGTQEPGVQQPATEPAGMRVSFQGEVGVGDFASDLDTDRKVTYGALLGLHLAGPIALELEYQYSSNDFERVNGSVRSDAVVGHLRFDVLRAPVVPFIYGGVGWFHWSTRDSVLDLSGDNVMFPLGAGVELVLQRFLIGVRGEYQWIVSDVANQAADFWKVVGTIGFRI